MSNNVVITARDGKVLTVTINRPEVKMPWTRRLPLRWRKPLGNLRATMILHRCAHGLWRNILCGS